MPMNKSFTVGSSLEALLRFKDWRLRTKLGLPGAIALAGLLAFGIASYVAILRVAGGVGYELKLQEELGTDLTLNIIQMRLVAQNMILRTSKAERDKDFAEFETLARKFEDSNARWNQALPEGELNAFATVKARQAGEQYIQRVEHDLYPALLRNDRKKTQQLMREMQPLVEANSTAAEAAQRIQQAGVAALTDRAKGEVTQGISILAGAGIVVALAVGLLGFLISRSILGPLAATAEVLESLAENDLRHTVAVDSSDEIGAMAIMLNHAISGMASTIHSIAGTAERVAGASEELSCSSSQQAQTAHTQKDQTSQVAIALQQISATVLQVSDNSAKAAEASRQAAETARQGGLIVDATLLKMRAIAESVHSAAQKLEELGKSSDQIGRIVGVINDIADRTSLLALNAAIEAAHAGEQGRGFAVVADEVRKLAERTTSATKEIAQMIETVQEGTRTAVNAMEHGTQQVEEGVRTTSQAGDALKEIIQMADQVGEMVTQIATAAIQQSSATEEINNRMDQIAKAVGESAVGAQQSAKACQELSGFAFDLQKMVGNFKLPDNGAVSPRTGTSHLAPRKQDRRSIFDRESSARAAGAGAS